MNQEAPSVKVSSSREHIADILSAFKCEGSGYRLFWLSQPFHPYTHHVPTRELYALIFHILRTLIKTFRRFIPALKSEAFSPCFCKITENTLKRMIETINRKTRKIKSHRRESDPRPADYKSAALPTELRWHCSCESICFLKIFLSEIQKD